MPGTIVYNNSCGSIKTDAMWDVFKSKGASTYLGYDGNVRNEFAIMNLTLFFANFIDERQSVFNSASFMVDKYYRKEGSSFMPVGQGNYKIARDFDVSGVKPVLFPKHKNPKVIGTTSKNRTYPNNSIRTQRIITESAIIMISVDMLIQAIVYAATAVLTLLVVALAVILSVDNTKETDKLLWDEIEKKIKSKSPAVWNDVVTEVKVIDNKNTYANSTEDSRVEELCETDENKKQIVEVVVRFKYTNRSKHVFTIVLKPKTENAHKVNLTASLLYSDTDKNGAYEFVDGFSRVAEFNHPYKLVCPRKTGYFKIDYEIPDSSTYKLNNLGNKFSYCINRTGHVWSPLYNKTDKNSGASVTSPPANYRRRTNINTYKKLRTADYVGKYIATYNNTYKTNYTKEYFALKMYQVHHIQPLIFLGSNLFHNLIHLKKWEHAPITAWFRGY